jgi:thiamine-phosphate pyrophosphorylase
VTLCLVTDRRRLTTPDAPLEEARRCLLAQARHAVAARLDLIQLRERDLEAADLAAIARELVAATRGSATRLVVNDRLDVALACGADGVHLRADSITIAAVRRLAPRGFLVGRSVHRVDDAAEAGDADYLIAGTVFASQSKPSMRALLSIEGLRAIVSSVAVPVLAIGGITADRCDEVAAAGAAGVAAIEMFMAAGVATRAGDLRPCRATSLDDVVARVRSRFDSGADGSLT